MIGPDELEEIAARYKRVAGFAISELGSRPSLAGPVLWKADAAEEPNG